VDLAVLAPTLAECERGEWLGEAAVTCSERLALDGLVYALLPRAWRSRARARLEGVGLAIESSILHLPDASISQHLIPLELAPAGHALASIVPIPAW
jgi:hypothetical protein